MNFVEIQKMEIKGWRYYNHAAIPDCAPHEKVNIGPIQNKSVWRIGGGITLLARWTSDYGNDNWGEWYHCIKDTPFELSQLRSKQRYEINKGRKYFNVANIHPKII